VDVSGGESVTLEFKKSTAEKDKACRTLCAFANGQGGDLVFGVTPSGKVVGQKVTDRTLEELAQEFQGFEPSLNPHIQRIPIADEGEQKLEALVIRVERSPNKPVSFRGVPYERVLNTTRVMPRSDYQRHLLEAMHSSDRWEIQAAKGCHINDLDLNELVLTIEEAIRRGRLVDPGTRDPLSLLQGLGLLVHGDLLSCAAVALFCKDEQALPAFPQFQLRLARFKGKTRDEFLDNRQYSGNAFGLLRRAERFLLDWLPIASKIVPGQLARTDTPALPMEAVREALANAFAHRDYSSPSGAVSVALYDDRLEIISPGELHFGLTPEKLYQPHESKPWNPWIAKVFYRRGLIETWGRGTLQIVKLMQEAGLTAPQLQAGTDTVSITFALPGVPMQEKSSEKILEFLQREPSLSAKALAEKMNMSSRAVEKQIGLLKKTGKLRRIGPAKGGTWRVEN
jgi:ATP-dependent DNA helicase RecG